jgi:hypothetical protein
VINASNFTSKNNPLPPIGPPAGLTARPMAGLTAGPTAGQMLLGWLAVLPGRLGDRLFMLNDNEAGWRDWQVVKAHGGLARRYRDPRFDRSTRPTPLASTAQPVRPQ